MSTSLLYHASSIRGYQYTRTEFAGGRITFGIGQEASTCRCSACESADLIHRGEVPRTFHLVPIGRKPTAVALGVPRVE